MLKGHTGWVRSCAFSPDGRTLASASWDKTVRLWDARSGEPINTFTCLGIVETCSFSPLGEMLAAGDKGGNIYILELIGFDTKPIVITAVKVNQGLEVRCPHCMDSFEIEVSDLGCVIPCPDCGAALRVNPFTVDAPDSCPATTASNSEQISGRPEEERPPMPPTGHQDGVA